MHYRNIQNEHAVNVWGTLHINVYSEKRNKTKKWLYAIYNSSNVKCTTGKHAEYNRLVVA